MLNMWSRDGPITFIADEAVINISLGNFCAINTKVLLITGRSYSDDTWYKQVTDFAKYILNE